MHDPFLFKTTVAVSSSPFSEVFCDVVTCNVGTSPHIHSRGIALDICKQATAVTNVSHVQLGTCFLLSIHKHLKHVKTSCQI